MTPPKAIIISSGRSGTTYLSKLISEKFPITIVQEFFSYRTNREIILKKEEVTSQVFWEQIDVPMDKRIYKLLSENLISTADVIHKKNENVMLRSTLPRLFSNPTKILSKLKKDFQFSYEINTKENHLNKLFSTIAYLHGNSMWIEKTGGNIRYFSELQNMWPDSQIIYLTRSPKDVALSKIQHNGFLFGYFFRYYPEKIEELIRTLINREKNQKLYEIALNGFLDEWYYENDNFLEKINSSFLEIKFYDLINSPQETIKQIEIVLKL